MTEDFTNEEMEEILFLSCGGLSKYAQNTSMAKLFNTFLTAYERQVPQDVYLQLVDDVNSRVDALNAAIENDPNFLEMLNGNFAESMKPFAREIESNLQAPADLAAFLTVDDEELPFVKSLDEAREWFSDGQNLRVRCICGAHSRTVNCYADAELFYGSIAGA
ncbi:hypothetical protein [Methylotenera sp.]|uniref:hypothetical protein n=1 Tax=Methylotenera sp. TaxID=2051956 RepID=UPI002ED8C0E5